MLIKTVFTTDIHIETQIITMYMKPNLMMKK